MRGRSAAGRSEIHPAAERGSWRRLFVDRFGEAARHRHPGDQPRPDDLSARAQFRGVGRICGAPCGPALFPRSEEHTSELQSLMRISYDVFCLKKKTITYEPHQHKLNTTPITIHHIISISIH